MSTKSETARWLREQFVYDERLGIPVPSLTEDWDEMSLERQTAVLTEWEHIRGSIPDHIKRFEDGIRAKQDRLFEEDDFAASCRLNGDIADLASRINDLHIWFRTQQDLDSDTKMHG